MQPLFSGWKRSSLANNSNLSHSVSKITIVKCSHTVRFNNSWDTKCRCLKMFAMMSHFIDPLDLQIELATYVCLFLYVCRVAQEWHCYRTSRNIIVTVPFRVGNHEPALRCRGRGAYMCSVSVWFEVSRVNQNGWSAGIESVVTVCGGNVAAVSVVVWPPN